MAVKQLLSYDQFIKDDSFAERRAGLIRKHGTIDFFRDQEDSICPFCRISADQVHKKELIDNPGWLLGGIYVVNEYVWCCSQCGWWRIRTNKQTDGAIDAISAIVKSAVLKKYNLSSKDIPITLLQQYLREKFEDVIHIHDKQMEKLVQSVFSEHFSCEVEHIGKSHDGGIDLLLIQSSKPTVIQVKRRRSLNHIEAVSGVRELLGAALLKESKNCIYVSTCSKFSKSSQETAESAVELGIVESYELYDFSRFSSVLKLAATSHEKPWMKYVGTET